MQTIKKLKSLVGYEQTDDIFKEYLLQLEKSGVITISDGDISGSKVSDELYTIIASIYGVQLDEDLNPLNQDEDH